MNIELKRNIGYKWFKGNNIHVKGYIFDEYGKFFENDDLVTYFKGISSENELYKLLLKTNGYFSVVINTHTHVIAAVDRVRSLPLLYSKKTSLITDDSSSFTISEEDFSDSKEDEFLHCGFISGKDTLVDHINQIQAGELLVYDKELDEISFSTYFELHHSNFSKSSQSQLIEDFDRVVDNVFRRYISSLNGRTVVVPLSAGYDSRLIVQKLHQLEYKNVICFSYGKKNNWESTISEKAASFYGYKWLFVEYTKKDLFDLYQIKIDDYMRFATNLCSSAHTQDLLAVKKLKSQLPKDAVFMPGHALDFIAGNHIPTSFTQSNSISNIISQILQRHFSLMGSYDYILNTITQKIKSQLTISQNRDLNFDEASTVYEKWVWKERQCKYIANSVRVYDYYDFQWMIPLWDNEIIDFWSSVPAKFRFKRKLFLFYAKMKYDSKVPLNPSQTIFHKIFFKLNDIWYSRFIKKQNLFSLINYRLKHLFPDLNKDYIDINKRLVLFPKVGLNILQMLNSIKKK